MGATTVHLGGSDSHLLGISETQHEEDTCGPGLSKSTVLDLALLEREATHLRVETSLFSSVGRAMIPICGLISAYLRVSHCN